MGDPDFFEVRVDLTSWALPLAIHHSPYWRGLSFQFGPVCFVFCLGAVERNDG